MKSAFRLRTLRSFLISVLILSTCGQARAQSILKIFGQVISADGPAARAQVSIEGTPYHVITGEDGYYYFYDLPPGNYRFVCHLGDIAASTGDKIVVRDGPPIRRDIFLASQLINVQPVLTEAQPAAAEQYGFNVKVYDLRGNSPKSIDQVLRDIPGLNLVVSPATGESYVSAGGLRPEGMDILIDGRKVNSLLTGRADLNQIPLKAVTRIEYYTPGTTSGSASGGLAGTVNFITAAAPTSNSVGVELGRGSFASENYGAKADLRRSKLGRLHAIWEKGRARNDYEYTGYFGDVQKRQNAHASHDRYYLSYASTFGSTLLDLSGFVYNGKNGVPGLVTAPLAEAAAEKQMVSGGGEVSRRLGKRLNASATFSLLHRETTFQDFGSFIPYDTKYLENESDLAVAARYDNASWLNLDGRISNTKSRLEGFDYIRPSSALGQTARSVLKFHGAVGLNQRLGALSAKASLAQSFNRVVNDYLPATSLTASFTYSKGVKAGIISSYSRSFRLPGLAELHWHEDVFVLSNPDLKPERSRGLTIELFGEYEFLGRWRASLEYKDVRYTDLIYWRRSQGIKYKPVNVSAADFFGTVAALSYRAAGDLVVLKLSREKSVALNREQGSLYYGKRIIYQPLYTNRLAVQFNYGGCHISTDMLDSGHRFFLEENTKWLAAYTLVNLELGLDVGLRYVQTLWELRIENLTNRSYELLEYQPMPPRSLSLAVTVNFKEEEN